MDGIRYLRKFPKRMNKRRENGKFAIFWDAESMKKSEEKYFRLLEEMEGRCYHTGRRGKDDGG